MNKIWQYTFLGNTLKDWLIAIGIIVIASVAILVFKKVIVAQLKRVAAKTKTSLDDLLISLIGKAIVPLGLIYSFYFGLHYLQFTARIQQVLHLAILFATTFFIIRIVNTFVAYTFEKAVNKKSADDPSRKPAKGVLLIINIIIWLIGIVFIIDNLGYDITTIVTGLGIGGIAIALASQAVLADLFSYIVIFFDKPFEPGDFIIVDDKMGTVEYVGIKTTRIRTLNGEQLICSNTDLTNSRVHNYKRMDERRVVFSIGVIYDTPSEKLESIPHIVKDIITSLDNTRFDRAHFSKFGSYSLDFEIVYYVLSSDYNIYMDKQQAINLAIYKAFEQAGIGFAYPTQSIIMEGAAQKG